MTQSAAISDPSPTAEPAREGLHAIGDAYYLGACAMCGGPLGAKGETLDRLYGGRDVRLCSDTCRINFEARLDENMARLDQRLIADQLPLYPLNASIVSGASLGAQPIDFICGNRLFRVAESDERDEVLADPQHYFRMLDRAVIDAQQPMYAMQTKCPVQGDILNSDTPIDIVVANRMVRVCCPRCVRIVRTRPSQYLSMVDYANREAAASRGNHE